MGGGWRQVCIVCCILTLSQSHVLLQLTQISIYSWFEERLELQSISDDVISKSVPPHVNIFYCFGGIVLTSFIIQVVTGLGLTLYYSPTTISAFTSVEYIVTKVHFGSLLRSLHRWSSSLMLLSLILHIFRVYLTGGLKKPRELIWVSGVLLSFLTLSFGVTGYSLPWDQISYWASKIVTAVPESIEELISGIGTQIVRTLRGSSSLGSSTLSRFYSFPTFLLSSTPLNLAYSTKKVNRSPIGVILTSTPKGTCGRRNNDLLNDRPRT